MKKNNKKQILNIEEREIEKALEKNLLKPVRDLKVAKKNISRSAITSRLKSEKISLRISKKDLHELKTKSMQKGIPYQTMINSLIRKYLVQN